MGSTELEKSATRPFPELATKGSGGKRGDRLLSSFFLVFGLGDSLALNQMGSSQKEGPRKMGFFLISL